MKKILVFEEVVKYYHTITVDTDNDIKLQQGIDDSEGCIDLADVYRIIEDKANICGVSEDYYGKTKSFDCIKVIDIYD